MNPIGNYSKNHRDISTQGVTETDYQNFLYLSIEMDSETMAWSHRGRLL